VIDRNVNGTATFKVYDSDKPGSSLAESFAMETTVKFDTLTPIEEGSYAAYYRRYDHLGRRIEIEDWSLEGNIYGTVEQTAPLQGGGLVT
jgi:hypothetical protein